MPVSDPGLRRVVVHAGGANVDLVLPATVSVAALIPSIVDILGGPETGAPRYRLSCPGGAALPTSTTLAQYGIRDGAILMVSRETTAPPPRRFDDVAEAVAAALKPATGSARTSRIAGALAAGCLTAVGTLLLIRHALDTTRYGSATAVVTATAAVTALLAAKFAHRVRGDPIAGLTLGAIAATFAAVAGLFAVPGAPGAPHVLLAAMAAAATAVLIMRLIGCGTVALTAVANFCVITAVAALMGLITSAPTHVIGSLTTLACLVLLETAPRISLVLAGLSPGMHAEGDIAARTLRADNWLTSLRAAFATAAAAGATVAAVTTHRAVGLAGATVVVLLLHARLDSRRRLLFLVVGIGTAAIIFVIAVGSIGGSGPVIAALTAALSAAAMYLGFVAPTVSFSPPARRGVEALGYVVVAAVVPLTCWACGAFSAIRGLIRA